MLPETEIEKTKQGLVELHKRVLIDYLTREGLSFKGRQKCFKIYDHYIDRDNVYSYFCCPCKIFVKALIKDKLSLIQGVGPLPDKKLRRHSKRKHKIISF